eukprot:NODE_31139_length_403_cov_1.076087.p1 GENE.NODE_31139_length_403_cov_1.076087~~NODE_31139_length_403_cov_1.076087.p1  ORF type:complete len:134 (-),score=12.13 NODE_31139_length_403_cov_1.076087:2-346(-)
MSDTTADMPTPDCKPAPVAGEKAASRRSGRGDDAAARPPAAGPAWQNTAALVSPCRSAAAGLACQPSGLSPPNNASRVVAPARGLHPSGLSARGGACRVATEPAAALPPQGPVL